MSKRILYLGLDPAHYRTDGCVTHWPIIQVVPRPLADPVLCDALHHFPRYTHVVVTSKSSVAILSDYLAHLGIEEQMWMEKITLAVGRVTAQHLKAIGLVRVIIAREETAEGVIQELKQLPLKEAWVFWPHSSEARPAIRDFLLEHNIRHTGCALYDPLPRSPDELPNLEDFDEIVFTSPSTVKAFFSLFGRLPSTLSIVAIGPVTARFLECLGRVIN